MFVLDYVDVISESTLIIYGPLRTKSERCEDSSEIASSSFRGLLVREYEGKIPQIISFFNNITPRRTV